MAVKREYEKPTSKRLIVGCDDFMEMEIVPVVSDGETETNRGHFDFDEESKDDELYKYPSAWN